MSFGRYGLVALADDDDDDDDDNDDDTALEPWEVSLWKCCFGDVAVVPGKKCCFGNVALEWSSRIVAQEVVA